MKVKCAIFDFDGTLFDSMYVWDRAGEVFLGGLGKQPKPSLQEEIRTMSLYQSACWLQKEYGLTQSAGDIMDGISRTVEHFYFHEIQPKAGVISFLEELRRAGVSMGIAAATERYLMEAALERCGMRHFFDAIFTCSEIGRGKDDPAIYRKAMAYFGADRSNTIVFEDAYYALLTAKADGFAVAGVYDRSETQQAGIRRYADCWIEDYTKIQTFREMFLSGE